MERSPHYFIAIPLAVSQREWLSAWQVPLQERVQMKQWPDPKDFHITLKFLGAMTAEKWFQLDKELIQVDTSSFSLSIGSLGFFGNQRRPRVMWCGVESSQPLLHLHHLIEKACAQAGFPKEDRAYKPHITIAKKWKEGDVEVDTTELSAPFANDYMQLVVDSFDVYRVHPQEKVKYQLVQRYRLRGGSSHGTIN